MQDGHALPESGFTVRDSVRALMRDWELTVVFGNPGSTELGFLRDWPDVRYILGVTETVAVAMADGYARQTGRPTVVNLHSAAGISYGMPHIISAYHHRSPLVIVAGQQDRTLLSREPFLANPAPSLFGQPFAKWVHQPARAADVPWDFQRAILRADTAPKGPVILTVPSGDWDQPALRVPARGPILPNRPSLDALEQLATAINTSRRPAFVVGDAVDADDAVPEIVAVAEKTRAPVWMAPRSGRSSFPEDHRLFAGFLPPARQQMRTAMAGFDLVVVVGAPVFTEHIVDPTADALYTDSCVYLIDEDEDVLARAAQGIPIRATPRELLRLLDTLLQQSNREPPSPRPRPDSPLDPAPDQPLTAHYVLSRLAETIPADALVVEEAPSHRPLIQQYLPIPAIGGGFLTTAAGVLGYGLPAAIGAAEADRTRPVVAILGDGSTMYTAQALWSAAALGLNLAIVILDNGGYAAVAAHAARAGIQHIPGTKLGHIDFGLLAQSLGCVGDTVRHAGPFREALPALFDPSPCPRVLHVQLLEEVTAPPFEARGARTP